jgi:hypothetical protein
MAGDELRRGLSFLEEGRLLAALCLDVDASEAMLGRAQAAYEAVRGLPAPERGAVIGSLRADLILHPLRPSRHAEWVAAERAELPKALRASGALAPDAEPKGYLAATRPFLSGRLRRTPPGSEMGSLVLAVPGWRDRVITEAVDRALTRLMRSLGPRHRLTFLASLGAHQASELRRLGATPARPGEATLQLPVLECLRTGFSRAASRARDAAHLRARFASFLLAVAMSDRYAVEVRALAEALPLSEGKRLVRYVERERLVWGSVSEAALAMVGEALLEASAEQGP